MTAAGIDQMDGTKSEWQREGERERERERETSPYVNVNLRYT